MPASEVARDRWGRPLIVPPGGGRPVGYTRASTAAKAFDDTYNLSRWLQRKVVEGMAAKPTLSMLATAHAGDNKIIDSIADQAREAAGAGEAAQIGTALHTLTENIDAGLNPTRPAEYANDLLAYERATAHMKPVIMEGFVVIDELKIAGSFDRIWDTEIGLVIGDLKTGASAPTFGAHAAAIQMALYAHGELYDPDTGQRTPLPEGLRQDIGLMVHLPIRQGACSIYEIDLTSGWEWAQRYAALKEFRAAKVARPTSFTAATVTVRGK